MAPFIRAASRTIANNSTNAINRTNARALYPLMNKYPNLAAAKNAFDASIIGLSKNIDACKEAKKVLPQFSLDTIENSAQRSKFIKDLDTFIGKYNPAEGSTRKDVLINDLIYTKPVGDRSIQEECSTFIVRHLTHIKDVLDDTLSATKICDVIFRTTEELVGESAFIDKDLLERIIAKRWAVEPNYGQFERSLHGVGVGDSVHIATEKCDAILRIIGNKIGEHMAVSRFIVRKTIVEQPINTMLKRYKRLKQSLSEVEVAYNDLRKILIMVENNIDDDMDDDKENSVVEINGDIDDNAMDDNTDPGLEEVD